MENIAFVAWVLGWPIVCHHCFETNDVGEFVAIAIWAAIGVLLYN